MTHYIDGFVFKISRKNIATYKPIAELVGSIWKEHGALAYIENIGDDFSLAGVASFPETLKAKSDEAIIFGWVVFESKASRNLANQRVADDPRMIDIMEPLNSPEKVIFDASKMLYGGFETFISV